MKDVIFSRKTLFSIIAIIVLLMMFYLYNIYSVSRLTKDFFVDLKSGQRENAYYNRLSPDYRLDNTFDEFRLFVSSNTLDKYKNLFIKIKFIKFTKADIRLELQMSDSELPINMILIRNNGRKISDIKLSYSGGNIVKNSIDSKKYSIIKSSNFLYQLRYDSNLWQIDRNFKLGDFKFDYHTGGAYITINSSKKFNNTSSLLSDSISRIKSLDTDYKVIKQEYVNISNNTGFVQKYSLILSGRHFFALTYDFLIDYRGLQISSFVPQDKLSIFSGDFLDFIDSIKIFNTDINPDKVKILKPSKSDANILVSDYINLLIRGLSQNNLDNFVSKISETWAEQTDSPTLYSKYRLFTTQLNKLDSKKINISDISMNDDILQISGQIDDFNFDSKFTYEKNTWKLSGLDFGK